MSESHENGGKCGNGCHTIQVPSDEEVEALNAMRGIKKKVRELHKAISPLSSGKPEENEEVRRIESEVQRLKEEWRGWEQKRKDAARARMILLGHEEPD